jgi:phage major head subunit gpT-like protein
MLRTNFPDLLQVGFDKMFFDNFNAVGEQWPEIFQMRTTERQYEDISYIAPFGTIPTKDEGVAVTYDDPIQGFDKRYTPDTYALAYRITQEMIEDELYNVINQFPASIGRSMAETRNISGAGIWNDGFDATVRTGGDGKELFATDHPLFGNGDQKNELTNAANLSDASLEQAVIDLRATTDDRGKLLNFRPTKLIIPPELWMTAVKLLESPQEPESGNNAVNPHARRGIRIVVNDYLTNTKAWFLQSDDHKVAWYDRIMPSNQRSNDEDTTDMKFIARARWAPGWDVPWGNFGSPGV